MQNKIFAERLNSELDNIGVPEVRAERINVLSKWLKMPKFKAESLLNGSIIPNEQALAFLASELEVKEDWLLGKEDV